MGRNKEASEGMEVEVIEEESSCEGELVRVSVVDAALRL